MLLHDQLLDLSGNLIDIGGEHIGLRSSVFAKTVKKLNVTVVNIDDDVGAYIICDAAKIPLSDSRFSFASCLI